MASAIAGRSRGESRLAGGVCASKVRTASNSAATDIPATIQNRGRQAFASACRPPMNGPRATAPKMHRFMITAVSRELVSRAPRARGGIAAINSRLGAEGPGTTRPRRTCPRSGRRP